MLCGVAPLPRWCRYRAGNRAGCVPLILLYFAAVLVPDYLLRIRKSAASRESYPFESPTSCLLRNRSGGPS